MDRSAIDRIAELGVQAAAANRIDNTSAVIIESNQQIESLECFNTKRDRYRGTFDTTSLPAFVQHVDHIRETVLADDVPLQGFLDTDHMAATVFFNLGDGDNPGHGDHRARLKLKPTAAWAALLVATGRNHDQSSLHDFVEDWRDHIVPVYGDTPDSTRMANALGAIRDITVEKARTVQSEVRDMGATASAMERIDATSRLVLPSAFDFSATPYEGCRSRTVRLRLGVKTGNDKIVLVLRLQQAEKVSEDIAAEVLALLTDKLGTSTALTLGTFNP